MENNSSSLESTRDKASYCLGLQTGRSLKMQFADIDLGIFSQGLNDSFHERPFKLNEEEVHQVLSAIQHQMMVQQKQLIAKISEENKKASEAFLEENKRKADIVTLPSGLQYKVLASGKGGASPTALDAATIHYSGAFLNGSIFESTYEQGKPKTVALAQVIPGWVEALKLMKVGDKWQIFIPPYLAYGEAGFPPVIAPNTLLVFDIELLEVNQES